MTKEMTIRGLEVVKLTDDRLQLLAAAGMEPWEMLHPLMRFVDDMIIEVYRSHPRFKEIQQAFINWHVEPECSAAELVTWANTLT